MKPINNYESVQASSGEFPRLVPGGYCVEIVSAKDIPLDTNTNKGDYLKFEFDICHGDFKGYYAKQNERFGSDWYGNFIKSYREKALGMFKHFINCVEESNPGYKWEWNEKSLVGKFVGVTLQEEEYRKNDGTIGVRLIVKDIKTCQQILDGDFKVPQIKKLEGNSNINIPSNYIKDDSDEDLPF